MTCEASLPCYATQHDIVIPYTVTIVSDSIRQYKAKCLYKSVLTFHTSHQSVGSLDAVALSAISYPILSSITLILYLLPVGHISLLPQ
jgi:hypothetical protein